jgi:fructoselysine-6-P-deglycase FrlB-like protein
MSVLWEEAQGIPDALRATLEVRAGFESVVERLSDPGVRRIVATGNGAAYYAAMALWLTSLGTDTDREVVALPAGLLAEPAYRPRDGDLLFAISSSGEFKDVIVAARRADRVVAVTADPTSSLGRIASASAVIQVAAGRSATHTQAYCAGVATVLALWASFSGDTALERSLLAAPDALRASLDRAEPGATGQLAALPPPTAAIAFGTGVGWAAALEAALLLKEVARVPAEGAETREGGTSSMYGLRAGHLVLSIGPSTDPSLAEAEAGCATTGATVLRVGLDDQHDARLAPLHSFPRVLALAIGLATRAGHDVDAPTWLAAYQRSSRPSAEVGETMG